MEVVKKQRTLLPDVYRKIFQQRYKTFMINLMQNVCAGGWGEGGGGGIIFS